MDVSIAAKNAFVSADSVEQHAFSKYGTPAEVVSICFDRDKSASNAP